MKRRPAVLAVLGFSAICAAAERAGAAPAGTLTSTLASTSTLADCDGGWTRVVAGESLQLRSTITAIVLDDELPGHPLIHGRGHIGAIADARLVWTLDPHLAIEAGVLARAPFALNFGEEAGVLPVLALVLRPLGTADLFARFGSLDTRHGYHPALTDEARYAFGRNYAETYTQSLAPGVTRELGRDLFMPAEHGAQLILDTVYARAEAFLDWQLLETKDHREKFAFGALASVRDPYFELGAQMRLVHYGGELFTRTDPIRYAGLDPVRQPTTYALLLRAGPVPFGALPIALSLPLAYVRGKLAQSPGASPAWHAGFEVGLDAEFFALARLGWRLWLPLQEDFGYVSEDGDPIYAGRRSHRATLALHTRHGPAELSGRLDLIFAEGADKVEYETVTTLAFSFDPMLWSATPSTARR